MPLTSPYPHCCPHAPAVPLSLSSPHPHRRPPPLIAAVSPQEGQQLLEERPALSGAVGQQLAAVRQRWAELESAAQARAERLRAAGAAQRLQRGYADLERRLGRLEEQLRAGGEGAALGAQLRRLQVGKSWDCGWGGVGLRVGVGLWMGWSGVMTGEGCDYAGLGWDYGLEWDYDWGGAGLWVVGVGLWVG